MNHIADAADQAQLRRLGGVNNASVLNGVFLNGLSSLLEIQAGRIFDANNREHTTLAVENGFSNVGLTEMTAVFDSGGPIIGTARLEVNEGILTNQGTIQTTRSGNCSNCGGRVIIAQLVNHGDGVVIVDYLAASVPLAPPIEG